MGIILWNEFSTSKYKNSPYMITRMEFVKNWLERECISIGKRSQMKNKI